MEFEIDLKELFMAVWDNLLLIIAVGILGLAVGYTIPNLMETPVYQAKVSMVVRNKAENGNLTTSDMNAAKSLTDTFGYVVKSDALLNPIIKDLQLKISYDTLVSKIKVSNSETQVVTITVSYGDVRTARHIAAEIAARVPNVFVEQAGGGNCERISGVIASENPVSPNLKKSAVMGAILFAGVVFVFVVCRELFDTTVKNEEQLTEKTGLLVLGIVPEIK